MRITFTDVSLGNVRVYEGLLFHAEDVFRILGVHGVKPRSYKDTERQETVEVLTVEDLYEAVNRTKNIRQAENFARFVNRKVLPAMKASKTTETTKTMKSVKQRNALDDETKIRFADCVAEMPDCISVNALAKIMRQNGYNIGQNRLFKQMREDGLLVKSGSRKNTPTQMAAEKGLFRVRECIVSHGGTFVKRVMVTTVTGYGQQWLLNYCSQKLARI